MIETISRAPSLTERLREQIKREGPITFHDWMKAALYDPDEGYYCSDEQTKWGREGDYRTSPERSSLFGATFARYLARLYEELGRPAEWTVVEAGAGDGHFAYDVLLTFQNYFPDLFAATRYIIDETSSTSRGLAAKRLEQFSKHVEFRNLDDKLDEWKVDTGIVFSNELLDALPVHRVSMIDGALLEFYVNLSADGEFGWMLGPASTPYLHAFVEQEGVRILERDVVEVNLEIEKWLRRVSVRLRRGYVVTVDYGFYIDSTAAADQLQPRHETLRSFRRHKMVEDVLAHPGEQDLTTSVDWAHVKNAGAKLGFEVIEFARQDKFLLAAGLLDQLHLGAQQQGESEKLRLSTAAREMIMPDGMAASFQVLVQKKTQ